MSEGVIEKLLFLLLGGALSAAGFLAKRRLQNDSASESLDRKQKVLAIHDSLKQQGLSAADLEQLERNLLGAAENSASGISEPKAGASDELLDALVSAKTQAEMNQVSGERARRADFVLDQMLERLRGVTSTAVLPMVDIVQNAWLEYRRQQVEFVGYQYEGGSIRPLIENSEYERLTRQRIAEVKAMVENEEGL